MLSRKNRLTLFAAGTTAVAAAAAILSATGASAAAGCRVDYQVTSQWQSGFGTNVSITNLGDPISGWTLTWTYAAGQTVTQAWNATVTQSGGQVSATNASYNGGLTTNATTAFGFNASWNNNTNPVPASFALNGTTCTGSVGGPSTPPSSTPPSSPPPSSPPPSSPPPSGSTPVAQHGQLRVCGTRMCDRNNATVQLRGVSSMWLNWESTGYAENLSALTWMRDNWNLTVIRAAMGVEPTGAYLSDPNKARGQVERIINNAVTAGVYVIVDWHAHEAANYRTQAVSFFADLARRYGNLPNIIWEPFNEPLQVSWTGVVKPYHEAVVSAIRAADPDNIVVLGTPNWSQGVDQAVASPVAGTNLMYTLHFYSCSHGAWLRDRGSAALQAGLALFVTEWGASHADGGTDGVVCQPEAQAWLDWMKSNGVSWTAWKLSTGTDSTNLLAQGAPVTGGWNNYLHGHAPLVVANMK